VAYSVQGKVKKEVKLKLCDKKSLEKVVNKNAIDFYYSPICLNDDDLEV
jgi:hypothetical protein